MSQAREEGCGPGETTEGPVIGTGNNARDRLNQSGLPHDMALPASVSTQCSCRINPLPCSQTFSGSPLFLGEQVQGLHNLVPCL